MIVSECCGAKSGSTHEDGPSWADIGVCPECREHCEFVDTTEEETTTQQENT